VVQRKALTLEKWQAAVQRQVGICAQHSTALGFGEGCTTWAPWCAGGVADADCSGVYYHVVLCVCVWGGYLTLLQAVFGNALHSIIAVHCASHKMLNLCLHTCWMQLTTD
jgi:hypothetical protein